MQDVPPNGRRASFRADHHERSEVGGAEADGLVNVKNRKDFTFQKKKTLTSYEYVR